MGHPSGYTLHTTQPVVRITFEQCSVGRWIYPPANYRHNKMEGMVGCVHNKNSASMSSYFKLRSNNVGSAGFSSVVKVVKLQTRCAMPRNQECAKFFWETCAKTQHPLKNAHARPKSISRKRPALCLYGGGELVQFSAKTRWPPPFSYLVCYLSMGYKEVERTPQGHGRLC